MHTCVRVQTYMYVYMMYLHTEYTNTCIHRAHSCIAIHVYSIICTCSCIYYIHIILYFIVFKYLYSAPQQPWTNTSAFGSISYIHTPHMETYSSNLIKSNFMVIFGITCSLFLVPLDFTFTTRFHNVLSLSRCITALLSVGRNSDAIGYLTRVLDLFAQLKKSYRDDVCLKPLLTESQYLSAMKAKSPNWDRVKFKDNCVVLDPDGLGDVTTLASKMIRDRKKVFNFLFFFRLIVQT